MMLFFVFIVFHIDPASGLPNTINVCVITCTQKVVNRLGCNFVQGLRCPNEELFGFWWRSGVFLWIPDQYPEFQILYHQEMGRKLTLCSVSQQAVNGS